MLTQTFATRLASALAGLLALTLVPAAQAQDLEAMLRRSQQEMAANIARGEQMVQNNVTQRMQDPAVQQAWQRHLQQTGGRPGTDYRTFTYNYIYTNGFSAAGIAQARRTEQANQAGEMRAWQGLQQAQQQRGQAQQGLRDSYFANQQEAGRQLQGNSTYVAPNGQPLVLPHTWQRNTTYHHQGATYHVDGGGRYYVLAADGWWYPLAGRR